MDAFFEFLKNRWDQLTERPTLWWQEWRVDERGRARHRAHGRALAGAQLDILQQYQLVAGGAYESQVEHEEREMLASRRLRLEARRLRVPEPDLYGQDASINLEAWNETADRQYYLSPAGFKKLRDDVRQELLATKRA